MKNLKQLRDERAAKFQELQAVRAKAEGEKRGLNAEERSQWNNLKGELEELDAQIKVEEDNEALQARMAGSAGQRLDGGISEKDKRAIKGFSFRDAARAAVEGKMEGLVKEMHEEAENEARSNGVEITGVGIPALVTELNKRDMTATGGSGGNQGGNTIATELKDFVDILRAKLILPSLGARFITGLEGNFSIMKKTGASAAQWAGENDESDESEITTGVIPMTPKRLTTFVDVSRQLLIQSSIAVEQMIREDLATGSALALQIAAINGSGSGFQPKGVLQYAGVLAHALGTNGAALTYADIVKLETLIATADADVEALAYLINPATRGKLKTTSKAGSEAVFVMGEDNRLNGYNTAVTTQVPGNLTKGTGTNLSALIFGNWSDLVIGQWGGLDLFANPYTKSKNGIVEMQVTSFNDIALRRENSFAVIKDAITA